MSRPIRNWTIELAREFLRMGPLGRRLPGSRSGPYTGWPAQRQPPFDVDMTETLQSKPSRFDLTTPEGRRRAEADLVWADHGFLRSAFS